MGSSKHLLAGLNIAYCPSMEGHDCLALLKKNGIGCLPISHYHPTKKTSFSLLIVDQHSWNELNSTTTNAASRNYLVGCEEGEQLPADFFLPRGFPLASTLKNIEFALTTWLLKKQHLEIGSSLLDKHTHLSRLAEIGIALSAEKDLSALLTRILLEGRELARCDAASLFLIDQDPEGNRELVFKLAQNASVECDFQEQRFRLDDTSIVGYVACHNRELSISNAYQIERNAPYQFNPQFDEQIDYRTVSLLTIPITNHLEEVIGVLQFINRTRTPGIKLSGIDTTLENTIPFDEESKIMLRALASQSAIAIENRELIESIRKLFDGFVKASVMAIEQRDPATSGHSFRVADLCHRLADVLPRSGLAKYQTIRFDEKQIRQLRYAALLHDFGKVGVKESVLVKPKKLTAHQFDIIRLRILLTQKEIHNQALQQCLKIMQQGGAESDCNMVKQLARQEAEQIEDFWKSIQLANEPKILPEEIIKDLHQIHQYQASDILGGSSPLIAQNELLALSIPKGSLTAEERTEIESHVIHTENFLRLIPWTPELGGIPDIAAAHHEKMDGSGYPKGLTGEQIPLPSKIMTVCDIYDALTASDRPYKQAVPQELAYKILQSEAERQLLDPELVSIFIEAEVYKVIAGRDYSCATAEPSIFHHHVCDVDLEERCTADHCDQHQHD